MALPLSPFTPDKRFAFAAEGRGPGDWRRRGRRHGIRGTGDELQNFVIRGPRQAFAMAAAPPLAAKHQAVDLMEA